MVMLMQHAEITARHKKTILYRFGPPESTTLRPVLDCIEILVKVEEVEITCTLGRMPLPALYCVTDKVGGPESKSVTTGKPIYSQLQYGRLIRAALIRLDYLGLHAKLSSRLRAHMSGEIGLLTGQRVFWWAGPTCWGRL
jgi:hypothetical protein